MDTKNILRTKFICGHTTGCVKNVPGQKHALHHKAMLRHCGILILRLYIFGFYIQINITMAPCSAYIFYAQYLLQDYIGHS